jgi:hypothetical protein
MTKAVGAFSPMGKDSRASPWTKLFELINIKIYERVVVVELWWWLWDGGALNY